MPNNAIEHRFPTTDKLALVEHYQGKPQAYRDLQAHNFHLGLTPLLHVHRAQSSTSIQPLRTRISCCFCVVVVEFVDACYPKLLIYISCDQTVNIMPSHSLGNFYPTGRLL